MSGLFCSSPQLCILERQMQQPPGYRPRGQGICIMNAEEWKSRGNYTELVDCVISSMQMEHLKKRISEIFEKVDKEMIFGSMKYRKDFYFLLTGRRGKNLCMEAIHRITRNDGDFIGAFRQNVIRVIGSYGKEQEPDEYEDKIKAKQQEMVALIAENAKTGSYTQEFDERYRSIAKEIEILKQ